MASTNFLVSTASGSVVQSRKVRSSSNSQRTTVATLRSIVGRLDQWAHVEMDSEYFAQVQMTMPTPGSKGPALDTTHAPIDTARYDTADTDFHTHSDPGQPPAA
jgi:hypothetical protein